MMIKQFFKQVFILEVKLALLLLTTGTFNTIGARLLNMMESRGNDNITRRFQHPFLQAWTCYWRGPICMMVFLFIQHWKIRQRIKAKKTGQPIAVDPYIEVPKFNVWLFLPPALLDVISTSLTYSSLTLTYTSSSQMLRGAVIIFTALLSKFILGKSLGLTRWCGIIVILSGLIIVGSTDLIWADEMTIINYDLTEEMMEKTPEELQEKFLQAQSPNIHTFQEILIGDSLVLCSQILVALQYIYEEKYIMKYNIGPVMVVAWEGYYAFVSMAFVIIPMYFIEIDPKFGQNPRNVLEDALEGFQQLRNSAALLSTLIAIIASVSVYAVTGITITKELSATTRVVLDSIRTLIIWMISILAGWQHFRWLHIVGFAVFLLGMCIYHELGTSWFGKKVSQLGRWIVTTWHRKTSKIEPGAETQGDVEAAAETNPRLAPVSQAAQTESIPDDSARTRGVSEAAETEPNPVAPDENRVENLSPIPNKK